MVDRAVAKRRTEFSAGRHCARSAMAQLGRPVAALLNGADRAPIWPPGLVGSITHDAKCCAAVVASEQHFRSIGIDLESIGAVPAELADRVLRPDEIAKLDRLFKPDGADWLTLSFCLKEASYKAFYPVFRRIIDFHDMRLSIKTEDRTYSAEVYGENSNLISTFEGRYLIENGNIHAGSW